MYRLASLFTGLLMVSSLSGCCLLGHGGGYSPYGGGGGCGPCQSGACGAMANPQYPSANLFSPAAPQLSMMQGQPTMVPQTQMVMTDNLSPF